MQITHESISSARSPAESGGDGGRESDDVSESSGSEASSCRIGELASFLSGLESRRSLLDDGRINIVGNSVDISACT